MAHNFPHIITINDTNINLNSCDFNALRSAKPNADWWIHIFNFLEELANNKEFVSLQTSGSTGSPKIIKVEKFKLFNAALRTVDYFQLNKNHTALLCLSANYIAGKMMLVRALVSGMHLIAIEPSSNPVVNLTNAIDFSAMVPMQLKEALKTPEKLQSIRLLIIGGGKVNEELNNGLKSTTTKTFETFGMTETLSHIALRQINPINEKTFKALPGVELSQGFKNELIISIPNLGIYQYKTTDIIELKSSSTFQWLGRKDFVINSGGIKLHPESLENKLAPHINFDFCFIGIPDKQLGEKLILVIETVPFDTTAMEEAMEQHFQDYEIPKNIAFIDEFPRTNSGKIKRKVISALMLNS